MWRLFRQRHCSTVVLGAPHLLADEVAPMLNVTPVRELAASLLTALLSLVCSCDCVAIYTLLQRAHTCPILVHIATPKLSGRTTTSQPSCCPTRSVIRVHSIIVQTCETPRPSAAAPVMVRRVVMCVCTSLLKRCRRGYGRRSDKASVLTLARYCAQPCC